MSEDNTNTETEEYRLYGGAFIGLTDEFEATEEHMDTEYDPQQRLWNELENVLGEEKIEELLESDVYIEIQTDDLTRQ